MIIAPTETGYRLITQPAHATLAGAFARNWGSEPFHSPEPRAAVLAAADLHDDGWAAYDRQPRLGPAGEPIGFTDVSAQTWIELYNEGINSVIEIDLYAGLLVSMHGTGLRRRRYGLSPTWSDTPDPFKPFVNDQEAKQQELIDRMLADGDPRISRLDKQVVSEIHATGSGGDQNESRVWNNYKLLQAWDSLSLAFCTSISGPSNQRIESVPSQRYDDDVTLTVQSQGKGKYSIDPYPFGAEPLRVSVPARTVERSEFDTEYALVMAYYRAELERITFTFVPAA